MLHSFLFSLPFSLSRSPPLFLLVRRERRRRAFLRLRYRQGCWRLGEYLSNKALRKGCRQHRAAVVLLNLQTVEKFLDISIRCLRRRKRRSRHQRARLPRSSPGAQRVPAKPGSVQIGRRRLPCFPRIARLLPWRAACASLQQSRSARSAIGHGRRS